MIKKFKLSPCCLALISIGVLAISSELYAREFFNPAFLTDLNGSDVSPDLSAFEVANSQAPGNIGLTLSSMVPSSIPKMLISFLRQNKKQAILTRREKSLNYTHAYQQRN